MTCYASLLLTQPDGVLCAKEHADEVDAQCALKVGSCRVFKVAERAHDASIINEQVQGTESFLRK